MVQHACLRLGSLNSTKGEWAEAAAYFELFLEKYPDDIRFGQVLYDLGRAYEVSNPRVRCYLEVLASLRS